MLACAEDAQRAGASALLLAPVSCQPLTGDEVFTLFQTLDAESDLPIIVCDNPATTHFEFSLGLYGRLAELPRVAAVKIPPMRPPVGASGSWRRWQKRWASSRPTVCPCR